MKTAVVCSLLTFIVYQLEGIFGATQTASFAFTGSIQSFTIPDFVTSIEVTAIGATGGQGGDAAPGAGGKVVTTLDVVPGTEYNVYIGGQGSIVPDLYGVTEGGFNGGSLEWVFSFFSERYLLFYDFSGGKGLRGGGGGGQTQLAPTLETLSIYVIAAGGGGSADIDCPAVGGDGGYTSGGDGAAGCSSTNNTIARGASFMNGGEGCVYSANGNYFRGGDSFDGGGGGGGGIAGE